MRPGGVGAGVVDVGAGVDVGAVVDIDGAGVGAGVDVGADVGAADTVGAADEGGRETGAVETGAGVGEGVAAAPDDELLPPSFFFHGIPKAITNTTASTARQIPRQYSDLVRA
jgi:hypothetical protein